MLFSRLVQFLLFYCGVDFQVGFFYSGKKCCSLASQMHAKSMWKSVPGYCIFNKLHIKMQYGMYLFHVLCCLLCFSFPLTNMFRNSPHSQGFGHNYCTAEIQKVAFYSVLCSQSSQNYFAYAFLLVVNLIILLQWFTLRKLIQSLQNSQLWAIILSTAI